MGPVPSQETPQSSRMPSTAWGHREKPAGREPGGDPWQTPEAPAPGARTSGPQDCEKSIPVVWRPPSLVLCYHSPMATRLVPGASADRWASTLHFPPSERRYHLSGRPDLERSPGRLLTPDTGRKGDPLQKNPDVEARETRQRRATGARGRSRKLSGRGSKARGVSEGWADHRAGG